VSQKNRIYILAGQSWGNGQTGNLSTLPAEYTARYMHTNRIWGGTDFEPIYSTDNNNQFPIANRTNGGSIEFKMEDIADATGNDIYILKYSQGSTRLELDGARTDWNVSSVGELYDNLVSEIASVEAWMTARGKSFEWAGLIWWQGEGDTVPLSAANAYQTNLQNLYDGLCTATSTTLKIWQYNIVLPPSGNREYLTTVNAAKAAFTALDTANRRLFTPIVTSWNADDIHPSMPTGYFTECWDNFQRDLIITDL
jgi:hypothetical protein